MGRGGAIKHHAIDDGSDNHSPPHKLPNGFSNVSVIAAQPSSQRTTKRVRPKKIEQPLSFRPFAKRGAEPGYSMIGHHFIEAIASGLGVAALVGQGLFGGADPAVKDGSP